MTSPIRAKSLAEQFPDLGKRTLIMGVLNVTPDSFSDGGEFLNSQVAVAHALEMAERGADIIDVGGESTRPTALPISEEEEGRRLYPVLKQLSQYVATPLSVDTYKSEVAKRSLELGAGIINDVTALRGDPKMVELAAETQCPVVLMHAKGGAGHLHDNPEYDDLISELLRFFEERIKFAERNGVHKDQIIIDPGIGFGKKTQHNLEILRRLDELKTLGQPILVGTSRKRFIGELTGREMGFRLAGTLASVALAISKGAYIVRVHDVEAAVDAAKVADAVVRHGAIKV